LNNKNETEEIDVNQVTFISTGWYNPVKGSCLD